MRHPADTVTTPLMLSVSATTGDADLAAELHYDPTDPLAVSLAIGTECGAPVMWVFSRELLAEGLQQACGEGDITIEPVDPGPGEEQHHVRVTLATDCVATMLVPRNPVVEFLVASFTAVASGTEMDGVDLDAEIAALFAGDREA